MGTTLLLVAMIAPSSPGQIISAQNHVAFEQQRQAVEHFHIVGNPAGQSRLVGKYPIRAGDHQASPGPGCVGKLDLASSGPFPAWPHPAASTIGQTSPASPSLPDEKIARSRADDGVFRQSLGQAGMMYDLAVHPSAVGRASAPHPAMRIPSPLAHHHRPTRTPRENGVWTARERKHQQETRAKPPTPVKRPQPTHADRHRGPDQGPQASPQLHHRSPSRHHPNGATPAQARARIRNLKALAKEAKQRNLSDIAAWLQAEAERLSQRVRTLQERRELQHGLRQERHHLTQELERVRRMEQLIREIGKAEQAGNPQRAKTLMDKLRGLAERRHRP